MTEYDPEIEYLRAVEDLFTTLRGVPHTLSPKDVQLARQWWNDQVPLAAIGTGVGEVLDRKRAAGEDDPVVSLSYCRHAVRRSARRIADQRVGLSSASPADSGGDAEASVAALAVALAEAADQCRGLYPAAAEVVNSIAGQVAAAAGLGPAELDENLFALETALLEGCHRALPADDRARIQNLAANPTGSGGVKGSAANRATKALRDRAVRRLLSLPRLEVS